MTEIYFNGINGNSGEYLLPPMELSALAEIIQGEKKEKNILIWLAEVWHKIKTTYMGLPVGVEPSDVTQAGWGIVFASGESDEVQQALEPLIEHRRKQINNDAIVKVLEYKPGEKWEQWLGRHGVAPGSIQPAKIPFYLLLVGSPEKIPFEFGHLLDVEYSVGRLHFDTPEEYSNYVHSLVDYETSSLVPNRKEVVFFAPRHPFDPATKMSADFLINPLVDGAPAAENTPAQRGVADAWGFKARKLWGDAATKTALAEVIQQPDQTPPALLFTASHGIGFPKGDNKQYTHQGALVCQDWKGFGSIKPEQYFSADDVNTESRVQGMVIFHFACYGGGTPAQDLYIHKPGQAPPQIAERPFIANLPKKWLAHPGGGALGVIGHVERAWGYSILAPYAGQQVQTFQNTLGRILIGQPIGFALKDFNERYAALSTGLSSMLQQAGWGANIDPEALTTRWIERNDAEGYVLIGDPAAAIRIEDLKE